MRLLLIVAVLLISPFASGQLPTVPPACATALAAPDRIACATHADCEPQRPLCTREFNRQLHHAWNYGSCIDPTGTLSATHALQADLCTIPDPKYWGGSIQYNLPTAVKLKIDDADQNGVAVDIWRRVIFDGAGTPLTLDPNAPIAYTALRVVVPLPQSGEPWTYPNGDIQAAWSMLRDVAVSSEPMNVSNRNIGVTIAANSTKIQNLKCWGLGDCLQVDGRGDKFNSDASGATDVTCQGMYGVCMHLEGGDANGFIALGWGMFGGPGVLDNGFLQNNYFGLMCDHCGERTSNHPRAPGSLISFNINSANAMLTGIYLESGDPAPFALLPSATIVGGNSMTRWTGNAERFGGTYSKAQFRTHNSPYIVQLGGMNEALLFQARANTQGVPSEIYAQQLRLRNWGTEWFWGLFNEDQSIPAPFRWRSSDVQEHRGRMVPSNKLVAEQGPGFGGPCCDLIDNDWNGKTDCEEPACGPEICC